jgi:hypothetical protein
VAELPFNVLAAMKHVQNLDVLILHGIDDHILPNGKAAQAGSQIIAGAAHARILAEQGESLGDGIDDAIGGSEVATFLDDVSPDVAEFGRACGARRCAILPCGVMLAGKLRPAAPFHVLSQRTHRILGDFAAFAAIDRGLGNIDSGKDFAAATFALNPKVHRGPHGIFRTLEAAAGDGFSHKVLLFEREVYLHASNVTGAV